MKSQPERGPRDRQTGIECPACKRVGSAYLAADGHWRMSSHGMGSECCGNDRPHVDEQVKAQRGS